MQTYGLDLLKCVQMVNASLNELKKIQRSMEKTKKVCDEFILKMNNEIEKKSYKVKFRNR